MGGKRMTDEEINMEIAKICGWKILDKPIDDFGFLSFAQDRFGYLYPHIPKFCDSLNEMHHAETHLDSKEKYAFAEQLCLLGDSVSYTARQRAEAFLRTMGKWEEAK
jgi:hypothetical protein